MRILAACSVLMASLLLGGCTVADANKSAQDAQPQSLGALGLPLVPWEGGPAYWNQFPKAAKGGWTDPSFFPIVVWFNGVSSQEEIDYDKKLGINTYIGMPEDFDAAWLDDNGQFYIGASLNDTFSVDTPSWVGYLMDDEVDGRYEAAAGREHLAALRADKPKGLFGYSNYTYMVLENDMKESDASAYVNDFTDVVSVDKYWYTIPHCSNDPYRDVSLLPVAQESCRSSSSYGRTMQSLRVRDAMDGKLQPLWQFVENMTGADLEQNFTGNISPDQLRGAVMNSLINEARGIVYFNQAFAGDCKGGNVFRLAQVQEGYCGAEQVKAARKINSQIHELAPVLNTQTLDFTTSESVDSMLKVVDGSAYFFAMPAPGAAPGQVVMSLPEGVAGTSVEVLFEDRKLPVSDGTWTDSFAHEYSYHIYKVKL